MKVSLGIADCLQEYQQMRTGSVYWLTMDRHIDALRLSSQIISNLDVSNRAVVVGCNNLSTIISDLNNNQGPADLRVYTLKPNATKAILRLTEQLDRKLRPRQRLIVCLLPIESISFLDRKPRSVLKVWRDWCENNNCTLLVLAYGENSHRACRELSLESQFLSGSAHFQAQTNNYLYSINYWLNDLAVQGSVKLVLQDKNTAFQLLNKTTERIELRHGQVFLQRSVLEGVPVSMADKWHIVESWSELVSTAQDAVDGTFVFALGMSDELEPLARLLHSLRQQRGPAVRLVVREMRHALRKQEVALLEECGAAMIVSANTQLARFFSMLEHVQNQQSNQPLTKNLDAAIAKVKPPAIKGIVSVFEFTSHIGKALSKVSSKDESMGILVTLRAIPMLTVEQLLRQLKITRQGDCACTAEGVVYLFLFGCQVEFVELALQRIFTLPFDELVAAYQVHNDSVSINSHIKRLSLLKTGGVMSCEVIDSLSIKKDESISYNNHVFNPYIKPLLLK